jgi:hypothetical protein
VAFVTSESFGGNLGGVAGGDAKCQAAAAAVPALAGKTWKAWLSDATTNPSSSFSTDGMFVTTTGAVIADSWSDFRDTVLLAPMSTETGTAISTVVWTGTDANGVRTVDRCNEWTSADGADFGSQGDSSITSWYWSYASWATCDVRASLYCIEQ